MRKRLRDGWLETLCVILTLAGIVIFLTSCDSSKYDKLPLEHFNDDLMSTVFVSEYGIALSNTLKLYTVYGKYHVEGPMGKQDYPAGLCITTQEIHRYPIQELLDKYPNLKIPQALEAADKQKL